MNSNPFSHRPPRQWLKINLTVPAGEAEIVGGYLSHLTGNGFENLSQAADNSPAKTTLIGYLEINQEVEKKKEELENFLTSFSHAGGITVDYSHLTEEDWGENWKKNFQPFQASRHIVIKPSWATYPPAPGETIIEIDPGMAFGTGHHESTCLALELLDNYFNDNTNQTNNVLDVGTGTGILGISCCLLGKSKVLAIDNDPDAIAIARKNVERNKVADSMNVADTPLSRLGGEYDLIIANIIHDVLLEIAPQLSTLIGEKGELILSGILKGKQAADILETYCGCELHILENPVKGEWQAFRFKNG